jgi:twinkle protein
VRDPNDAAARGASILDRRIIAKDFDWEKWLPPEQKVKVRPASDFGQEVIDGFLGESIHQGAYWPWDKANDLGLRFRQQEVTVYAGINGHRKSTIAGQIALHLMRYDEPCLITSLEMPPVKTLHRMAKQSAGTDKPSLRYLQAWNQWTEGRLWIYDWLGFCEPRQVLAVSYFAAHELGVRHIFLDSLMKIVAAVDDYTAQKRFVADLNTLAMTEKCHVHLIAHARKGRDEADVIDKFDVKGAGEIIDQADNAILVQKNLREKDVEGSPVDQFVTVSKQRDGVFEGTMGLWFNPAAMTFGEKPGGHWPPIIPTVQRQPGEDA